MRLTPTRNMKLFTIIIFSCLTIKVHSHASIDQDTATAGESYKAVLRITHGCNGSPTVSVRVRIPDGVIRTKPMPKAGWELETLVEKLDEPYDLRGAEITQDVRELTWKGGSLSDDFFDEFIFRAELPDVDEKKTIYFRTVQECENGEFHRWIETPNSDEEADSLNEPAPALNLLPSE